MHKKIDENVDLTAFPSTRIVPNDAKMSQARFELATYGLEDRCSIQLSYYDKKDWLLLLEYQATCYIISN